MSGLPIGQKAGDGGTGGSGGSGYGGGINMAGGTVVLAADTVNDNIAQGGQGGNGGSGGDGPLAVVFGGSTIITGGSGCIGTVDRLARTTVTGGTGVGTAINSAGVGGDGGDGGEGDGGGLYVLGGALTLTNDTIAGNSAEAGASGSGGPGGKAGTGTLTGGPGIAGAPGDSFGGGLYVNGGVVNFLNTTVALNSQDGSGDGGGVVEAAGTVTAVSTLFADNGPVDYSGSITATDSLFQTAPINGTLSGSGNLVGVDPLLDANGLQNNGGPSQTIALQAHSPAIGAGANPENLFTDQRGYHPRTGLGGTDIGAYQSTAVADTTAPTATLQATNVTSSNATSLNPYTFTITYSDNVAISVFTLPGSTVQVVTSGIAPISATVVSTTSVGSTDALGDAQGFIVTYQITPPGGSWTAQDNGTYTVSLGGTPITDLTGNPVPAGSVGTFTVSINANSLVVTTQPPSSVTAGNSFGLAVSVENSQGTVQTGFTGSVTIALASNPDNGTLNGTLTVNASAGVATFSGLTLDQAANGYTIQATTTGLSSATTNAFDITPAAASQLVVTTQPSPSTIAGKSFGLTVSAEDQYGNLTPSFTSGVTIALKSNPGSGTLNGTLTVNASAGVATFSGLTLDQAANGYTIQATTTGLSSATTNTFDITPAAASQLVVTTQPPASTTAGNSFGLTVTAEDLYGNLTPSFTSSVTVALKSNPGNSTLNGTLTVNASAGVATFSGLSIDQAANGYTIQATTTGLSSVTTNPFDITPAAASQLVVSTQPPASTTAGTAFGLTISAEDLYGNLTPSFTSSITIALKSNPGSGTLNGTLSLNASAGVATFSGLTLDQVANGYTIQAATTGLSSVTTNPFDITPAATSQLVVTTQPPASTIAGDSFGLTVSVEDNNGNLQTGFTGSVTIALESNPGSGTLNGALTVNASAGVAVFAGLTLDQAANGYTIQATATGVLSSTTTNAFDITPASASQLVVTTEPPASTTAGNSFVLSISAEDLYGNLTPSFTSSVTVALKSNPGSGTLNGTLTVNASAGVATFSGLSIHQAANGYTIQATTTGLSSATTNAFDITPAAASQLVVTTQPPSSITAGNSFGLTVSAEDLYGNLTPSFTSSVTIALESNPGNGTLNGTLSLNAGAGVATFSGLTLDQAANGYTIQATTTGLSAATTNAFNITPAAASQLVVTTQPPTSITAGDSFGLTVTAEDPYGNLTPSFTNSVTVALKSNPGSGTLNGTLTVNASAGVAAFSGLSIDQAANGYTIQATTTGLSSATTNAFDITPAAASQLVVTTQPPASTIAGNSFGLTVTAEDPYGNLTPSFTSSVTVALKSNPGSGTLNGTLTVNANAGVATFSGLSIDQAANGYTIQATTTGLSSATTNVFDITPAAASQLVVTTQPPGSTTAGNVFGLTVSAEDLYGNLTPSFTSSVTVALKSNPGSGTLNGTLTVNASAGVATFSGLSIDQAANGYTIQATTTGLSSATTNAFDITPAAASQLVVTTQPPASTAAGSPFGLTVSAEDLFGNLTPSFSSSVTIALESNPGDGTLNGTLTINASAGVATFAGLTIGQAANGYTIQATTTGLSSATTNAFDITPAATSQLVVTTQPPASITAGNSFGLTVSVEDNNGNVQTGFTGSVTIALESNPGNGTLNGTLTVDASAGVATFSGLTLDQAADGYTIQATTAGLSSATTNAFDITPPPPRNWSSQPSLPQAPPPAIRSA